MSEFFRFPHTSHLAWLGSGQPRDDKVLPAHEVEALLTGDIVVEEKVDGANIGFSISGAGALRVQNRGQYLDRAHSHPQFQPLWSWLPSREAALVDTLYPDLILFGEWCFAVHSVVYDRLPDWFLGFDVYDRRVAGFWDTERRDMLLADLGLAGVPRLAGGGVTLTELTEFIYSPSRVGRSAMEGVVVRTEYSGLTAARAKLVRPEFAQAIDEHWSRGPLRRNELVLGATPWR
ncbi:MAG: RNA ligase family protein [Chloroflexi bacterium]|nr:RNA ligase family protein [Chloroflexota bacterium]